MDSVLIIHIGAGRHSAQRSLEYKKLLKRALRKDGLVEASRIIEASALTNTGYGSSLDRNGNATSDASLIEVANRRIVKSLALVNINTLAFPTSCVDKISRDLERQYADSSIDRIFGLSRPSLLDYGSYVRQFKEKEGYAFEETSNNAFSHDGPTVGLILKKAKREYTRFSEIYTAEVEKTRSFQSNQDSIEQGGNSTTSLDTPPFKKRRHEDKYTPGLLKVSSTPGIQDTVGYIEMPTSNNGNARLATSSGGNIFRLPGRISCAGILGAGIAYSSCGDVEVCCMCSGNGDDIITMNLASYLSGSIVEILEGHKEWPDLGPLLVERITKKSAQVEKTGVNGRLKQITYVGVVMVIKTRHMTSLVFCHSTESFYFAFRVRGKTEMVFSTSSGEVGEFLHGEYKLA